MTLSDYRKRRVEAQWRDCAYPFFRKWQPPKGGVSQWFAERGGDRIAQLVLAPVTRC